MQTTLPLHGLLILHKGAVVMNPTAGPSEQFPTLCVGPVCSGVAQRGNGSAFCSPCARRCTYGALFRRVLLIVRVGLTEGVPSLLCSSCARWEECAAHAAFPGLLLTLVCARREERANALTPAHFTCLAQRCFGYEPNDMAIQEALLLCIGTVEGVRLGWYCRDVGREQRCFEDGRRVNRRYP